MPRRSAVESENAPLRHPAIRDIRDLLTFRVAMLAAANDRVGQSWLQSDFGLRILEWRVLGLVWAMQPVRFGAVARALLVDKGQLSRLVKQLIARGLITNGVDKEDLRNVLLKVTAKGRRLHERVLAVALARNDLVLSALSAEEADMLFHLLDKLQPFMDHRVDQVDTIFDGAAGSKTAVRRSAESNEK